MNEPEDFLESEKTLRTEDITSPFPQDNLINALLDGRYLIEQKLGQGGFGSVYLGSDNKVVPRKIVIKVMHLQETANDWSRKKFHQEFEALARINHPSVVGVLDCGETTDGRPYIVMQYIDGVSLRSLIESSGMPLWRVANIIRQVGKALSAAHHVGITHRDLKPENIMVQANEDEEYVKIIDFGVAKVKNSIVDVTTAKDLAVGTIAYMSPEQLSAHPVTPESDIYSMGVIAYEMITGKRPLNPESGFQLLDMQRSVVVSAKPSEVREGVSKDAEEIILKALSFEPNNRYQRARDFGDLLASALLDDAEQTQVATRVVKKVDTSTIPETPSLETAHVLFIDIVGYSRLLIDDQKQQLIKLQQLVTDTSECKRAKRANELIALPTGDGMALVFFNDPEAPVKCAVELGQALNSSPEIKLRMGVHSGLVYRMADIKNNLNVAGGGINIAQRVMDCGDSGHILLSKRVADDLGQLARWSTCLHDLGEAEVKHGVLVHVFNLAGDDFGNRELPLKFKKPDSKIPVSRLPVFAVVAGLMLIVVVAAIYLFTRTTPNASPNINATSDMTATTSPERSIKYWFNYQKTNGGKLEGEVRQSAGYIAFGTGWRFQFNLLPAEQGSLYLLNVAPTQSGGSEYNILFPIAASGQTTASLAANQPFKSEWARFVDQTGVEEIWIIWSTQPIAELDSIFKNASDNKTNPGVITSNDEIATLKKYLDMRGSLTPSHDREKKQTTLKGTGNILVESVELSHESN